MIKNAETAELRIKPLPVPPEKQKISFRLPQPTLSVFDSYLAAYADIYGVEPDRDFIADRIFTSFFESDRAFAAYLRRGTEAEGAPAKKKGKKVEEKRTLLGVENASPGESAEV